MKTLACALLGFSLLTGCASAAMDSSRDVAKSDTYHWLHPKLGMVKVDRATNAIVIPR